MHLPEIRQRRRLPGRMTHPPVVFALPNQFQIKTLTSSPPYTTGIPDSLQSQRSMSAAENVQCGIDIAVVNRMAFTAHPLSGKEVALLPLPPLRTVLESFPSYGSSLN